MFIFLVKTEPSSFPGISTKREFGPIDCESDMTPFNHTDYYNEEMGDSILRQYVSFEKLVCPGDLHPAKLRTIGIEDSERVDGKRVMNLDPGCLSLCSVVLATTKEASHRVYIDDGIYGQPMLRFRKNGFVPFEDTYADYADEKARAFFNIVRRAYHKQLKVCGTRE